MEYGSKEIKPEKVYLYQGFDPATANLPANKIAFAHVEVVNQRDADLLFLWERVSLNSDFHSIILFVYLYIILD